MILYKMASLKIALYLAANNCLWFYAVYNDYNNHGHLLPGLHKYRDLN